MNTNDDADKKEKGMSKRQTKYKNEMTTQEGNLQEMRAISRTKEVLAQRWAETQIDPPDLAFIGLSS